MISLNTLINSINLTIKIKFVCESHCMENIFKSLCYMKITNYNSILGHGIFFGYENIKTIQKINELVLLHLDVKQKQFTVIRY